MNAAANARFCELIRDLKNVDHAENGTCLQMNAYHQNQDTLYVLMVMFLWFILLAHSCHKFSCVLAYHTDWNEQKIDANYRMYIHAKGNNNHATLIN